MISIKNIRLGSVGTGWIVEEFIRGMEQVQGLSYAACYSRKKETGARFAKEFGAKILFTDLEEMAKSDEIDAVYLASPNAFHEEQARLFLEHGKHVICEKPIAVSSENLMSLQALAAERGLVYMEALIAMHIPEMSVLEQVVETLDGVSMARIDFSQYSSKYYAYQRGEVPNIFNPKMKTGALMDLGIYCIYPVVHLFGMPEKISSASRRLRTGADGSGCAVLSYPDKIISITYSKTAYGACGSEIQGENGVIFIPKISKLTDMSFIPIGGEPHLITHYTDKYLQMSYEAQSFYDFITNMQENKQRYNYLNKLALNVCRVLEQISK